DQLPAVVELQEGAVERAAKTQAKARTVLEIGDAEDEVSDWLADHHVRDGWDVAPILVGGGLDVPWLEGVLDTVGPDLLENTVRWLSYTVETEALMSEIGDSVTRISTLLGAAKQYSQMDRAPYQDADLHELLDSTLVMLSGK